MADSGFSLITYVELTLFKKFKDQNLVSELSGHAPGSHAFARYREIDAELKREMVAVID